MKINKAKLDRLLAVCAIGLLLGMACGAITVLVCG